MSGHVFAAFFILFARLASPVSAAGRVSGGWRRFTGGLKAFTGLCRLSAFLVIRKMKRCVLPSLTMKWVFAQTELPPLP